MFKSCPVPCERFTLSPTIRKEFRLKPCQKNGLKQKKKRMQVVSKVGQVMQCLCGSELSDAGDERLKEQFVKRKYIHRRVRQGMKIYT